ncbi:MAG TPA: hypothetical protein VGE29_17145 [Prosthecobacter sp.]
MQDSSTEILSSLGIQMRHPSPGFTKWLDENQLSWLTGPGRLDMFPHAHSELRVQGRLWGYFWTEDRIKTNAVDYGLRYLGIGSLGSGKWIAVDTHLPGRPMIGAISLSALIKAEASHGSLREGDFGAFDLSLAEWLGLVRENPMRRDMPN